MGSVYLRRPLYEGYDALLWVVPVMCHKKSAFLFGAATNRHHGFGYFRFVSSPVVHQAVQKGLAGFGSPKPSEQPEAVNPESPDS